MLDSVQGRGPCLAFLPFVSNPELEGCIVTWDFMETIHSRSYTYIIKNLYSNPKNGSGSNSFEIGHLDIS